MAGNKVISPQGLGLAGGESVGKTQPDGGKEQSAVVPRSCSDFHGQWPNSERRRDHLHFFACSSEFPQWISQNNTVFLLTGTVP